MPILLLKIILINFVSIACYWTSAYWTMALAMEHRFGLAWDLGIEYWLGALKLDDYERLRMMFKHYA